MNEKGRKKERKKRESGCDDLRGGRWRLGGIPHRSLPSSPLSKILRWTAAFPTNFSASSEPQNLHPRHIPYPHPHPHPQNSPPLLHRPNIPSGAYTVHISLAYLHRVKCFTNSFLPTKCAIYWWTKRVCKTFHSMHTERRSICQ
ncbi:hypothetical protein P154DRAFT_144960 [Amniculicola lignicola CBS 123094]|uniref:Uncharacterized protein n=1 Tax=Amniculicola lignicola CBS 123094 TaxID=1392246 RepID=A0A6A5WKA1_9PLEO|nr:hypothetical protein P154DRAFT_144960 [Amniculicola lignicola CBS 123094]